ncbi:hypothetical protein JL721_5064 [Aureococcus anophagefferens]|nr:hypothetical protein JL721_5064 [Aureococcus anophagefferens]
MPRRSLYTLITPRRSRAVAPIAFNEEADDEAKAKTNQWWPLLRALASMVVLALASMVVLHAFVGPAAAVDGADARLVASLARAHVPGWREAAIAVESPETQGKRSAAFVARAPGASPAAVFAVLRRGPDAVAPAAARAGCAPRMYYSGGVADDARHATISALAGDRVGRDFLATKNVKLARAFGRKICCVHRLATAAPAPKTLRARSPRLRSRRPETEARSSKRRTTRGSGAAGTCCSGTRTWRSSTYELAHSGGGAIVDLAMYRRVRDRDNVEALLRAYHACRFGRSGEGGDTYDRGLARRSEVRKMLFDLEIGVANIVLEKLATCATLAGGGCARLDIGRFWRTPGSSLQRKDARVFGFADDTRRPPPDADDRRRSPDGASARGARTVSPVRGAASKSAAVATFDDGPAVDETFVGGYPAGDVQTTKLDNGVTVVSTCAAPVATIGAKLGVGAASGPASAAFAASKMAFKSANGATDLKIQRDLELLGSTPQADVSAAGLVVAVEALKGDGAEAAFKSVARGLGVGAARVAWEFDEMKASPGVLATRSPPRLTVVAMGVDHATAKHLAAAAFEDLPARGGAAARSEAGMATVSSGSSAVALAVPAPADAAVAALAGSIDAVSDAAFAKAAKAAGAAGAAMAVSV